MKRSIRHTEKKSGEAQHLSSCEFHFIFRIRFILHFLFVIFFITVVASHRGGIIVSSFSSGPFQKQMHSKCTTAYSFLLVPYPSFGFAIHISIISFFLFFFFYIFQFFPFSQYEWDDRKKEKKKTLQKGTDDERRNSHHITVITTLANGWTWTGQTHGNRDALQWLGLCVPVCVRWPSLKRKVNLGLVIRFIAFYILIQIWFELSSERCGHIFHLYVFHNNSTHSHKTLGSSTMSASICFGYLSLSSSPSSSFSSVCWLWARCRDRVGHTTSNWEHTTDTHTRITIIECVRKSCLWTRKGLCLLYVYFSSISF